MSEQGEPSRPERLGVLIKEAQAILHQRMGEALRPRDLSVPQYACLQALHGSPGMTSSELARRAFVSRQSMNVLLQGLERRGLVERSADPGPRRERTTQLTRAATALVANARADVAGVVDTMTAALSTDEQQTLETLLAVCRDAL